MYRVRIQFSNQEIIEDEICNTFWIFMDSMWIINTVFIEIKHFWYKKNETSYFNVRRKISKWVNYFHLIIGKDIISMELKVNYNMHIM